MTSTVARDSPAIASMWPAQDRAAGGWLEARANGDDNGPCMAHVLPMLPFPLALVLALAVI